MLSLARRNGRLYAALIIARITFAFVSTGYIHPDEYFQNGEVTAGKVFGLHVTRTWEWTSVSPVRSIVPPAFSTGIPMVMLKLWLNGSLPSPAQLFYAERASFLALSFVLDACVYHLVPTEPITALLLLASSHVMLTFQLRPFSNALEGVLLALALLVMNKILDTRGSIPFPQSLRVDLRWLAAISIAGVFTRVTFLAFALPILIHTTFDMITRVNEQKTAILSSWIALLTPALISAVTITGAFVSLDSSYFRGNALDLTFTPFNFLVYNLAPENLAEHGIHPRWLHVAVNLPMILGPPLFFMGAQAGWHVLRGRGNTKEKGLSDTVSTLNKLCAGIVITSLHLLSVQPHQEPRFLIPLVVPAIVLVVNSGFARRAGRTFWIANLVVNIVLAILFGVLHQGGVIPSLLYVHDLVGSSQHSSVVAYWKTYMPPNHLLGIPDTDVQTGRVTVADLAGASAEELAYTLQSVSGAARNATVYLVTPPFALRSLDAGFSRCFVADKRIFPHLDLDHIPESVEMGWQEGLSLVIYIAEGDCLRELTGRTS